jgi:serine protease inhibitor
MKKYLIPFLVIIISLIFFRCEDQFITPGEKKEINLTTAEQKISSSSGIFGLKLFKEINNYEGDKNIFISPLSISMALGMTLDGASGSTYDSMKSVLELNGLTEQEINESYKNLIDILTNLDPKIIFNIANSIWYRNTFAFLQDFVNTDRKYFNAEVSGLDFNDPASVDIINNWVNENTNGKIPAIIDKISPEMVMFLINAIYFKGEWKYQFDKDYTKNDFFTTTNGSQVSCKMIQQGNNFNYFSNDLFQAVDLPYGDSSFSMIIFLPLQNEDINDVINQFSETNWNLWLNSFSVNEGNLRMPKFELKYDIKMKSILSVMGMGIAFSDFADFTKMYSEGGLTISEVVHKTYVKVDEEGTEGAAVTSVEVGATSVGGNPKFFMRIDRPFIFVIKDNQTNTILFIGKIINPSEM